MRFGSLPLLVLLAAAPAGAAERDGAAVRVRAPLREQYAGSTTIRLTPGQTRIDLGVSFIVEGSDSLLLDGVPLRRGDDYRINILKGTVILVEEPSGGERLEIRWSRFPLPFEPVFASRFPGERPAAGVTVPGSPRETAPAAPPGGHGRLRLSGNKTIGFSVGSGKDLGIDQSLKVTMTGTLAPDLEVRAYLTDDNLPVQPQGNTEELTHLDKVAVQVKSRHTETNLGDFSTGRTDSPFASFERELRGAAVSVDALGQHASLGGGIAKGRYRTVEFRGVDGMQGPYELLPARRFNSVIVLPGTEAVYLDGRRLRRGAENEYTIDYTRGTVSFTERITISRDSEIVVEFQSGEDGYRRSTVTGGYRLPLAGESAAFSAFYFREQDDPDRPVRGALGDEERGVLEGAGDDPSLAISSGISPVEDAEDAYVLVEADTVPSHFEFVETGGRFIVTFYEVDTGEGDYVTDGFTGRGEVKFRYAGEGGGNYRVGRPLALPRRHEVISLALEGTGGAFFAGAEGNVSLLDRNILSGIGDGDNRGGALGVRAGLRGLSLAGGELIAQAEYSSLEERYAAPDRSREPYFYRSWNLEDIPLSGTERIWGGTLDFTRGKLWRAKGGWHRLEREGLEARRGDGSLRIGDPSDRGVEVSGYDSRTGGTRDRRYGKAEAAFGIGPVLPRVSVDAERYRVRDEALPDTGRSYVRSVIALSRRGSGPLQGTLSYLMRRTDRMSETGSEWRRDRENDEIRLDGGFTAGQRIVEMVISHRETRYRSTGAASTSDLARVRYRDSWLDGSLTSDIGYRLSSGVDRRVEKAVVFVGENEGDYDESGNEVGQNRGDYMVIYLPAEDVLPVRSVELTWRLSAGNGVRAIGTADGEGGGWWGIVRRNVSVDHFFSVTERSTTDELLRFYTLDPTILQRDDVTLYGRYAVRQEWSLLGDVRRSNLLLILSREDEEDNRTEGISIERFMQEASLRFETVPVPSVTLTFEAAAGTSEREGGGIAGQSYRVRSLSGSQTTGWRPRPTYKISFEIGAEDRRDEISDAGQISFSGSPSLDASIGSKIHLSALLKLTWTDEREGEGKPLFFLEEGLREDWNVTGQYRFTKFVSVGLNYNGRREKDYTGEVRTVHALKLESRAYF